MNFIGFPKKLIANVLLDENSKIVDWATSKRARSFTTWIRKTKLSLEGIKVESKEFITKNDIEYKKILIEDIPNFYRTFETHPQLRGWKPY